MCIQRKKALELGISFEAVFLNFNDNFDIYTDD
jgi:hypothetical protein